MTDCGCLGHARPLRRELPNEPPGGWPRLGARLLVWRLRLKPDERQAQIYFGVGLATLDRIERGEIEPDEELAERIGRVLDEDRVPQVPEPRARRLPSNSAADARPRAVSPAIPPAGEGRGAPTGEAGFPSVPPLCSAPTFALGEREGEEPFIAMDLAGDSYELPLVAAEAAAFSLLMLTALARSLR